MPTTIGTHGEDLAVAFLRRHGCRIVDRNVYVGADEIDIIIEHAGRLAAIEVKTATGRRDPVVALDEEKFDRFRRAVSGLDRPVGRLDLVAVHADDERLTIRWLRGLS